MDAATDVRAHVTLCDVPAEAMRADLVRRAPTKKIIDRTGRVQGQLTVVGFAGLIGMHAAWLCKCECGAFAVIRANHLVDCAGLVSCGHCSGITSDGLRMSHPLYFTWRGIISRCLDPKSNGYHWYGARGITVCQRWHSFAAFIEDMGPKPTPSHSIDRYPNPDGNYEPGNCRWATAKQQSENKRQRVGRKIDVCGLSLTVKELAERAGISVGGMNSRIASLKGGDDISTILLPRRRKRTA